MVLQRPIPGTGGWPKPRHKRKTPPLGNNSQSPRPAVFLGNGPALSKKEPRWPGASTPSVSGPRPHTWRFPVRSPRPGPAPPCSLKGKERHPCGSHAIHNKPQRLACATPTKEKRPRGTGAFPGKWQALPGFHLAGLAVWTDGGVSALSFTLAFVVEVIEKRHRPFLDFHVLLNQGYRLQPRLHHHAGGVLPKHRVFAVPNHNGLFHEIKHDLLTYLSSQAHKFYVGSFPFPSRSYILSYLCHIFNMFRQVLQNIFWERELSFCPAPLKKTPENPGFSALFRGF